MTPLETVLSRIKAPEARVNAVRVARSALEASLMHELTRTDTKDLIRNTRVAQALAFAIESLNTEFPESDEIYPTTAPTEYTTHPDP